MNENRGHEDVLKTSHFGPLCCLRPAGRAGGLCARGTSTRESVQERVAQPGHPPCPLRALRRDHGLCCGLSFDSGCPSVLFLRSDRNSPCCKNCQFETAQKKCQEAINATCKGVSYCTGMSSCWFSWDNLLKRVYACLKARWCLVQMDADFLPLVRSRFVRLV